jgi:hypothetical protein
VWKAIKPRLWDTKKERRRQRKIGYIILFLCIILSGYVSVQNYILRFWHKQRSCRVAQQQIVLW